MRGCALSELAEECRAQLHNPDVEYLPVELVQALVDEMQDRIMELENIIYLVYHPTSTA